MHRLVLAFGLFLFTAAAAQAQHCSEVRFQRGAYSGEVSGTLRGGDVHCYTIGTGIGQTMRIEVLEGPSVWFMIPGVTGGIEQSFTVITRQNRYYFEVTSLAGPRWREDYSLLITIR